jgi:DNA primase
VHDIAAIRHAHPIAEAVAEAGVVLAGKGRRLVGRCPFHEETAPSFTVYVDTASWFCFGCRRGGDVIDFVGQLRGTSFKETAEALSLGLPPLPPNVTRFPARRAVRVPAADELAVLDATVAYYERTLTRYADVRAYLARRGVSLETARSLRLGYAAGGLAGHLRSRGLDLAAAERLGLVKPDGRERFVGRITIPDLAEDGRAAWLTGRAVLPRHLRYVSLDLPAPLLGLARVLQSGVDAVVLVEGPFDWLVACEWGIPAVALAGTHATSGVLRQLARFRRVYLALDADGPGRRAADAIASELGERAATVVLPPGVDDLGDLGGLEGGRNAFLAALAEACTRRERTWQTSRRDRLARAA